MRYLVTSLLCVFTLSLTAQEAGCTYQQADNYSSTATVDDGTCVFECITCGDGTILNENTQTCIINVSYCSWQPDSNADGLVGVSDLLDFLSVYGDTDSDGDGIFDSVDECVDLAACNYQSNPTDPCFYYLDALGVCGGVCPSDDDEDGVCDFPPLTDGNIHGAVGLWLSDESQAEETYGHISDWDVSSVTNMTWLFQQASSFTGDLSSWDVSSVTNMNSMFSSASSFNSDLSSWDVSSVVDMGGMFGGAMSFDGNLSSWDVSSVTNMANMFGGAMSFNGNISSWDVSGVTSMISMFHGAWSFNGDISGWDVSSVVGMGGMFHTAISFNRDLFSWDVSSVVDMTQMFWSASNFNGDVSSWDVSSVTSMAYLFREASSFNIDLSSWDVSSVVNMTQVFWSASNFNGDISSWDVSNVTNMNGMFDGAMSFDGDISSWDVSSVTSMENMFGDTALSEENQCLIHTSFSSNSVWPYDWSMYCPAVCGDLVSHEGYDYSTVQIGDQCWFSENCRYLPSVSPLSEGSETDPYYYVYDYEGTDVAAAKATNNYETYGVLYNWPAVMTEGICPSGWHIPSDEEWQTIEISLGLSEAEAASEGWRGSPVGDYMKSTSGWNDNGNGSNSSEFNGLPGGYRDSGGFGYDGYNGYWWSASDPGSYSWVRELVSSYDSVGRYGYHLRSLGFSARCVRD